MNGKDAADPARLRASEGPRPRAAGGAFEPIRVMEVEVGEPICAIAPEGSPGGVVYSRALALVRVHGMPVGYVSLRLRQGSLSASEVAAAIWGAFAQQINAHLEDDGYDRADGLDVAGLPEDEVPPCLCERRSFLEDAPFISIVVPTRDRPEILEACLTSILKATYPRERFEILVVDNAPRDDRTASLIQRLAVDHSVRYLREDRSGSASARNRGLCAAEGELVLFTDDDVLVDRHWLAETTRVFGEEPEAAAVTGLVVPREIDTQAQAWFEEYGGFTVGSVTRRVYNLEGRRPPNDPLFPYAAGIYGTGNNMAFRRAAIVAIGGFDPALGNGTPALGGVDSEVLLRTVLSGHTLVFEPRSVVFHKHRTDYASLRKQLYSYGVGLGAYLLKTALYRPASIPQLLSRVPAGIRHALGDSSKEGTGDRGAFPSELRRLELAGLAYSPVAYVKSRLRYGSHVLPLPCNRYR